MPKNSSESNPIANSWHNLPLPQKNLLVNLMAELVDQQPPNRSAGAKKGEVHTITAKSSQRLNIIGALITSGKLVIAKLWQSVNGLRFFGFLMALMQSMSKPLLVVLDNASLHSAKKLKPYGIFWLNMGCAFICYPLTALS